jgi:hypothetical protein
MLRTQGFYEGVPIGDAKLHSEVEGIVSGGVSAELLASSALGLQKPYGEQELGFAAGKIAQLKPETDGTLAVTISDGTQPCGIFADSFVDTLKSGKVTYYSFLGRYFTDQFDQSPANGAYAINDPLYVVKGSGISDAVRGLLTKDPAKKDTNGKIVAYVTQVPDLANGVLFGFQWQIEG